MNTISYIPPLIMSFFDAALLATPIKLYDDSERLWKMYQYISRKLFKKCLNDLRRVRKFIELEKEFLELYGRIQEKEAEIKEKTGKPAQGPFDYFRDSSRYHKGLFGRLEFKAW